MSIPAVLNKRHDVIPDGAVYIGRPSKYGNPYSHLHGTLADFHVPTREDAVGAYRALLRGFLDEDPTFLDDLKDAPALVCYCAPKECHGDAIQEELMRRAAA